MYCLASKELAWHFQNHILYRAGWMISICYSLALERRCLARVRYKDLFSKSCMRFLLHSLLPFHAAEAELPFFRDGSLLSPLRWVQYFPMSDEAYFVEAAKLQCLPDISTHLGICKSVYFSYAESCKIIPACLKIPALVLPGKLSSSMHSQSANFGGFKLNSHNLAGVIFSPLYLTRG